MDAYLAVVAKRECERTQRLVCERMDVDRRDPRFLRCRTFGRRFDAVC